MGLTRLWGLFFADFFLSVLKCFKLLSCLLTLADYWVNDTLMTVAARKKKLTKFN